MTKKNLSTNFYPISFAPKITRGVASPPPPNPDRAKPSLFSSRSVFPSLIPIQPKNNFTRIKEIPKVPPAFSLNSFLQPKVVYTNNKPFIGDSSRGAWRVGLKQKVLKKYNDENPTNKITAKQIKDNDLEHCHRIAFSHIQQWVVAHLNNEKTIGDFKRLAQTVHPSILEYAKVNKLLTEIQNTNDPLRKQNLGNSLLNLLNNSVGNVTLGNLSYNRSIGNAFAPNSNKGVVTPISQKTASMLRRKDNIEDPRTPKRKNIRTNQGIVKVADQPKSFIDSLDKNLNSF